MIIDEDAYLEHHGVKGQRWGIRRKRDSSGTPSSKKQKVPLTPEQKARRVEIGLAVLGGAIFAARVVSAVRHNSGVRRANTNAESNLKLIRGERIPRGPKEEKWLRQNRLVTDILHDTGKTKVSDIRPPSGARAKSKGLVGDDTAKFIKQFSEKQNSLIKESNGDLKTAFEKGNVPLHLRDYLEEWT